jgi:hypothetical protein
MENQSIVQKWTGNVVFNNLTAGARAASEMVKWKRGLSCRSRTAIIGKQVNLGLEISMNDTNYLINFNFPSQTKLKVIGHHTYVQPKLKVIGHFVRRPCKIYFKTCVVTLIIEKTVKKIFKKKIISHLPTLKNVHVACHLKPLIWNLYMMH